ncbi:MAG: mRNA surveillance protein pelota [Candidatus Micrarchaeia archaeon]
MKIIKFSENEGTLKIRVDNINDLWTIQRIIFKDDLVKSESLRKFKASDSDVGEMKEVIIKVKVEKTEFDKNTNRLRISGKIVDGRPLDYVKLGSYHTLNINEGDLLEITKIHWPNYIRDLIKEAIENTKKAILGIIVVDDEKALFAYLLGYGISFGNEIYSHLSKRMSQKDFQEQEKKYYQKILDLCNTMNVDTIIIAGPGFTKDNIKEFAERNEFFKKINKKIIFESVSSAERSAVYELIKSENVGKLLEKEKVRKEFKLMEDFLNAYSIGKGVYEIKNIKNAIENYEINTILVNDNVLGNEEFQKVLELAEKNKIKIEIISSDDEIGVQLHSFKDIVGY